MNGDTSLTNLTVVIEPASIHSGTRATNLTMQHLCQVEQQVEVLLRAHAVTTSHHDRRTLQVVLGSLHMVVEYFHNECLGADILRNLGINHFLLAGTIIDGLLHHTATNGSHLRTMVGVHDGSHDVTTKGRTNLIEQVLIALSFLLILIRTNLQLGTVCRQTRGQRR